MQFDVSDLAMGDEISVTECEELTQLNRKDRRYSMALVGVAKAIEAALWKSGREWTVCCKEDGIRILTHVEAVAYNASTFEQGKRKMRLAHRRASEIDIEKLPDDVRKEHQANLISQGRMISFMRQRQPLVLEGVKKITPVRT